MAMREVKSWRFALEARVVLNMEVKQAEMRQCRAQVTTVTTVDLAEEVQVGRRSEKWDGIIRTYNR